jgi:uncharacterized membrane protein
MRWWIALIGLVVGGFVHPVLGIVLGILGALFGGRLFPKKKDPTQDATGRGAESTTELGGLRREVDALKQRLAAVEAELQQLHEAQQAWATMHTEHLDLSSPGLSATSPGSAEPVERGSAEDPQPNLGEVSNPVAAQGPDLAPPAKIPQAVPAMAAPAAPPASQASLPLPQVETAPEVSPALLMATAAASADAPHAESMPAESSPTATPASASLDQASTPATKAAPMAQPAPPSPERTPPREPSLPLSQRIPEPLRSLIFGGNTLVKVGVLLLFLGLAFLLRYATERVTVPLPLRYAGVAGVGVALLALGWRLRQRRPSYALVLQGAAIGVFYLTTLGAIKLHALIDPAVGFAFLLLVTVLSGMLAVLQNALVLAVVAAIEGFAAPVLVSTGSTHPLGLFTYLTVLNLGLMGIAWFKAWRPLHLIGLAGTLLLAGGWAASRYSPEHYAITQAFLIGFMVMFSGIGLMFARRSLLNPGDPLQAQASLIERAGQAFERVGRVDSALVFGAPLSGFALQYLLVRDEPLGPALAAVGFGLFHLLLARLALVGRNPGLRLLAEAHAIVAVLFGTLAIPLGLEGQWTGAAWAVEAAGIYWLGLRQQRPYARLFSLAVLAAACSRLLNEVSLSAVPDTPWLVGSMLGPLMLSGSAAVMWWISRPTRQQAATASPETAGLLALEPVGLLTLPWLAAGGVALLPWMLLQPIVAPAALAALALALHALSQRRQWPEWTPVVAVMQIASVMGLLSAARGGDSLAEDAVLADGWLAVASAVFIAISLVGTAWLAARPTWLDAKARAVPPAWSLRQWAGLLAGTVLLHLAVLFVSPWSTVAWVWPLMALLTLAAGLRGVLLPLVAFSGGVQMGSALLALMLRLDPNSGSEALAAGLHTVSWTLLLQALVALTSAAWLQRLGAQRRAAPDDAFSRMTVPLAWTHQGPMRWLVMGAGLAWWLFAWLDESTLTLSRLGLMDWLIASMVALLIATGVLMRRLAFWREWPEMGAASRLVLPALALVALLDTRLSAEPWMPSHHGGWIAWLAALVWHVSALRRSPSNWPGRALDTHAHTLGLWLFTVLAGFEVSAHLAGVSAPGSTWALLGGVSVVAAVLFGLGHPRLQAHWPLQAEPLAYRRAAVPLAAWCGLWLWWANIVSSGDAAPLPALPLINPLEIGLGLVAGALLMWQRTLPADSAVRLSDSTRGPVWGLTALALLTGVVLRACHHGADIPWNFGALWASTLAQAAISITWALTGVIVMVWANRRLSRRLWMAGAALLAVVVVKLFVVELADHGSLYRIVSFIGVGVLLLLVGYFAPVPSRSNPPTADSSA